MDPFVRNRTRSTVEFDRTQRILWWMTAVRRWRAWSWFAVIAALTLTAFAPCACLAVAAPNQPASAPVFNDRHHDQARHAAPTCEHCPKPATANAERAVERHHHGHHENCCCAAEWKNTPVASRAQSLPAADFHAGLFLLASVRSLVLSSGESLLRVEQSGLSPPRLALPRLLPSRAPPRAFV